MSKKTLEMRELDVIEEIGGHDILVTAKGEHDYYDKCLLIAEIEYCYDRQEVSKKFWQPHKVGAVRKLCVKFLEDFAKIKAGR